MGNTTMESCERAWEKDPPCEFKIISAADSVTKKNVRHPKKRARLNKGLMCISPNKAQRATSSLLPQGEKEKARLKSLLFRQESITNKIHHLQSTATATRNAGQWVFSNDYG